MAAYANRSVRENREVNMEGKAADTGDRGYDFNDAFNRLCEVLGAGRQVSVGKILGVSQPSICYATKRRLAPAAGDVGHQSGVGLERCTQQTLSEGDGRGTVHRPGRGDRRCHGRHAEQGW